MREAVVEDCLTIMDNLRDSDRELLEYMSVDCFQAFALALHTSTFAYTWVVDEVPVCVWGVQQQSLMSGSATIWMLTTKEMEKNVFLFTRKSQMIVKELLEVYTELTGYVHSSNTRSIRWLTWLGFTIEPSQVLENGLRVRMFYKRG